jgi:hypothetical protein
VTTLTVTIDCQDLDRAVGFWRALLRYEPVGAGGQYASIGPGPGGVDGPKLVFQTVPEAKAGKNRIHLDLDLTPGQALEPEVERAVALGATVAGPVVEELGQRWQVMHDPEGNEFCIVELPAG